MNQWGDGPEIFEGLDPLDLNCTPIPSTWSVVWPMLLGSVVFIAICWAVLTMGTRVEPVPPGNQDPRVGWVEADGNRFKCVGVDMVYATTESVFRNDPRCAPR